MLGCDPTYYPHKTIMTQHTPEPTHTAQVRGSRTLASTVWLIPVAAAITGIWLLTQQINSKGPEIKLLMDNADGIAINTTTVRVLNVEVGRVSHIRLRPNQQGVEVTAQLDRDVADMMRKDTQFWVVKPRIDQNGVTGLGTLLSGSYISFAPGSSEEEASEFKVDELPPITAMGQQGLRLKLIGRNSKMIGVGSPVLYENHIVGTVESSKFNPTTQNVEYSIFVQSPNEKLIQSNSEFWLDSGVNVRLDGGGVKIDSAPLSAILSGAISFTTPATAVGQNVQAASNNQEFTIHNSRAEIENQPSERTLYYVAFFKQSIRGLDVGAPVEYKGIRIGTVAQVPYFQDGDSHKLLQNGWIPVRLRIDPNLMEQGDVAQSREYWQQQVQAALNHGLIATLANNNLILGSKMVELVENPSVQTVKPHTQYDGHTVIATASSGGLDELQAQLSSLLAKFNALPLDKTVGELNGSLQQLKATLASANKLISQNSTQKIPAELNATLQELRQTLQGVSPQSPVYQDIQQTLNQLNRTLQDAQPLIRTLNEKPNALIFNHSGHDPVPQGK